MENLFFLVGKAVCHQFLERTLRLGGVPLPFCARCTGIYLGIFCSAVFLVLRKRLAGNKPFDTVVLLAMAFAFLPMIIDGVSSYLGVRETTNAIRLGTGVLFGCGFPAFYVLLIHFKPESDVHEKVILRGHEYVLILGCGCVMAALIYYDIFLSWFFVSMCLCISLFLLLFGLVDVLLARLVRLKGHVSLAVIGACGIIGLFSFLRIFLDRL